MRTKFFIPEGCYQVFEVKKCFKLALVHKFVLLSGVGDNTRKEGKRGGRLEEEGNSQRRVENTIRRGGEEVVGSTSPLTKGKTRLPNSKKHCDEKHWNLTY